MDIVQEIRTKTGNLKSVMIEGVHNFSRGNNVQLRKFTHEMQVIWLEIRDKPSYPLAFRHSKKRDDVFAKLTAFKGSTFVIDGVEDFFMEVISDSKVESLVHMKLTTHLKYWIHHFKQKETLHEIVLKDAFRNFGMAIADFMNSSTVAVDIESNMELLRIWAKTLYIPRKYEDMGITPTQFYKTLYKNEKVYMDGGGCCLIVHL